MTKLTAEDTEVAARAARHVAPLDEADLDEVAPLLRVRELKRGDFLLKAGQPARSAVIVVHGLLREYFIRHDGAERTKAFVMEGRPSGSLADLLSGQPSNAFIVAEEPTRLCTADFAAMQELASRSPAWQRYGTALMRSVLLLKAHREYELMCYDAAERYRAFQAQYPGLEARVAARHVASYISVTPVHLSRLRRQARGG